MIPSLYYSQTVVVSDGYASEYYGEYVSGNVNESTVVVGQKSIVRLTRNDSYDGTGNSAKTFTVTRDYSSGWSGVFTIRHRVTGTSLLAKSVQVASDVLLSVSLSSADTTFTELTTDEDFGPHPFDIEMVSGISKQSAVVGIAIITKDQTTA